MNERAHHLGIPERHIIRALQLVRYLRASALAERLDPRATRIAIIYLNLVDIHFAREKLTMDVLMELHTIAKEYYDQARRPL